MGILGGKDFFFTETPKHRPSETPLHLCPPLRPPAVATALTRKQITSSLKK
jgi:hypothetical protein